MEIKGYTLHGDYYLADSVIIYTTWEEACEMKEEVVLPNGKTVVAHTLSKEELETVSENERKIDFWYWTSTPTDGGYAWCVSGKNFFQGSNIDCALAYGGARLGFKNPF